MQPSGVEDLQPMIRDIDYAFLAKAREGSVDVNAGQAEGIGKVLLAEGEIEPRLRIVSALR